MLFLKLILGAVMKDVSVTPGDSWKPTKLQSWFDKHACALFNFNKHPIDIRDLHIFAELGPARRAITNIWEEKDKKGMNMWADFYRSNCVFLGDNTEFLFSIASPI